MATGSTTICRDVVESLDDTVWQADSKTLQLTSASPKAAALLGYPRLAWISNRKSWGDIIHPNDRERCARRVWRRLSVA
jgi:PAS domain-containing protein